MSPECSAAARRTSPGLGSLGWKMSKSIAIKYLMQTHPQVWLYYGEWPGTSGAKTVILFRGHEVQAM